MILANVGLYVFVVFWLSIIIFLIAYSYESEKLDNETKAFLSAAYVDANHCVSSPIIIFLGSVDARKVLFQFNANRVVKLKQILGIGKN